jgi:uncharacterized protein with PIN domain
MVAKMMRLLFFSFFARGVRRATEAHVKTANNIIIITKSLSLSLYVCVLQQPP